MEAPEQDSIPYVIHIPPGRFTAFLVLVVLVLLTNHVMLQTLHYQMNAGHWVLRDLFDVDEEENFPTWYASISLLLSAGLLYAIASQEARAQARFARHWLVLSFAFLLLSLDEVAGIHEALNTVIDMPWTIPAAVLLVLVALAYVRFLIHLPTRTRIGLIAAGILFVGGAVAVEHVSDWYLEVYEMDSLGYSLLTAVEEGLEMFGVVLLIHTLLGYMKNGGRMAVPLVVENERNRSPASGS